jgi:glucan phosphoethanolaminetransferase (alkaline phosphatase superfamily)
MENIIANTVAVQMSFYKTFVKFRNSKKNVLKIVLIIVNINKDENKSLISNQFSLKIYFFLILGELFCGGKN